VIDIGVLSIDFGGFSRRIPVAVHNAREVFAGFTSAPFSETAVLRVDAQEGLTVITVLLDLGDDVQRRDHDDGSNLPANRDKQEISYCNGLSLSPLMLA
jgi:hypothetical protein